MISTPRATVVMVVEFWCGGDDGGGGGGQIMHTYTLDLLIRTVLGGLSTKGRNSRLGVASISELFG